MAVSRGNTRTITISFPHDLAAQAEQLAKAESRTMSELIREAFRAYRTEQVRKRLEAGQLYARGRGPQDYTASDVERLIGETGREMAAARRRRR